jgi:transposase-like protein
MGKKDKDRRVYPREFKADAAALAEKREKPISQIAVDLGVNESVLRRWMQQAREAERGVYDKCQAVFFTFSPFFSRNLRYCAILVSWF